MGHLSGLSLSLRCPWPPHRALHQQILGTILNVSHALPSFHHQLLFLVTCLSCWTAVGVGTDSSLYSTTCQYLHNGKWWEGTNRGRGWRVRKAHLTHLLFQSILDGDLIPMERLQDFHLYIYNERHMSVTQTMQKKNNGAASTFTQTQGWFHFEQVLVYTHSISHTRWETLRLHTVGEKVSYL